MQPSVEGSLHESDDSPTSTMQRYRVREFASSLLKESKVGRFHTSPAVAVSAQECCHVRASRSAVASRRFIDTSGQRTRSLELDA